ncbi:hypothetical protein [Pseudodesulfovibrio sp. zrk46]|uniref:hypothetical protein n=1 Tax=Pseudodesulfovibrio sp. zrk46 TaxID=2725288 RepID=UPI0014497777|nr:hypothetical protein [Pseudodesulfovibrio sp. zrk46]QJB56651.1 hypothetical protein HFN16_09640 [Pseudodesulfovibrio sp. zrk46]
MRSGDKCQVVRFLGTLNFMLLRVEKAYEGYLENGKSLLYASVLREGNEDIRRLLLEDAYLLPMKEQEYALQLLHHIDIWASVWDQTYEEQQPQMNDEFVFANRVVFPREEVAELLAYYESIKNVD